MLTLLLCQPWQPNASVDVSFFTQKSIMQISPLFQAYLPFTDFFAVQATWGMAFSTVPNNFLAGQASGFSMLNPTLAAHYTTSLGADRLRIGAALALPVVEVKELTDIIVLAAAAGARGGWSFYLFVPETMSIVAPVRYETYLAPDIPIALDGALFLLIPVGDASLPASQEIEVGIQTGVEIMMPLFSVMKLGSRFRAFYLPSFTAIDNFQVSFEPFFRADLFPAFLELGFTLNIDDPLGFSFETNRFWGLHFAVGGDLGG